MLKQDLKQDFQVMNQAEHDLEEKNIKGNWINEE